jgi:hypothetical protein
MCSLFCVASPLRHADHAGKKEYQLLNKREVPVDTLGTATPAQANASLQSNIRLLQARIKDAQFVNTTVPLYVPTDTRSLLYNLGRFSKAQRLKHLIPTNFIDTATTQGNASTPFKKFEQLQPGLHLKVINGAMQQFNQLYADTDPAAWRRCDPNNMDLGEPEPTAGFAFCVDRTKQPLIQVSPGNFEMRSVNNRITIEQQMQFGIWKITQMGGDPQRLNKWNDWALRLWP